MKKFITIFFALTMMVLAQTPQVNIPLFITDNAGGKDTLKFGLDPTATNGIDASLGEAELPPAPPSGVFDARFVGDDISIPALGQGVKKDYRFGSNASKDSTFHELKYQVGTGTVIVIKWNLPTGVTGNLQDLLGGIVVNKNMAGNDSLVVSSPGALNKLKMKIIYNFTSVVITPIINIRLNDAQGIPVDNGVIRTVRGVVSLANEINSPSYFQDATAGIALYSRGVVSPQLKIGDSIQVTGRVAQFRGLTQFDSVVAWSKLDSNKAIAPRVLTIPQINNQVWNGTEAYEGSLVRVNGVRTSSTGNFAANTNYYVYVGTDTVQMRVTTGTTLVGQPIPTGTFDVIGALGQYKSAAPYQGGYQVLCRMAADVIPQQSIGITAPIGAENWLVGTSQNITWTSASITSVKIEYTTNNGTSWITVVASVPATPAAYSWTIPNTPSTQCKVKVSDAGVGGVVSSTSPGTFTISAPLPASIKVTFPKGGEILPATVGNIVTWSSTNLTGNVNVYLSTNGGTSYSSVANNISDLGLYAITFATTGTQNKIKIESAANNTVFGVSDSNFTVVTGPSLLKDFSMLVSDGIYTQPLRIGIDPTATDGIDNALGEYELPPVPPTGVFDARLIGTDISNPALGLGVVKDYRLGNSSTLSKIYEIQYQLGPLMNNNGTGITVYWNFPLGISGRLQDVVTGTNIDVTMTGNGKYVVTNPSVYNKLKATITYLTKSINVTSPNGGENWSVGSTQNITWNQTGVTTVKLEYSTDNGSNWILIGTAPGLLKAKPNLAGDVTTGDEPTGTYAWTIPNAPSTQCRVKVSDNSDALVFGTSANPFTIVLSPSTLQFKYNLSTLNPAVVALYGAEFDGTNFWLSRWSVPTFGPSHLFKVNKAGTTIDSFTIAGLPAGGFRDLAWDGQYLYGAMNSTTIYQINTTTMTVAGTITAPISVRGIAYNKAVDGFWIGNWSTDIQLISRTGTILATLPATTHLITGNSGMAYDTLSTGGPFVWAMNCGTAGAPYKMFKLNATTGARIDSLDITSDMPAGASGGGLFVTGQYAAGSITLGGLNQGTPHLLWGKQIGTYPTVTVVAPNGGENWTVGTSQNITWTSANIANVKIEYTTNNGTSWTTVVASVPATPSTYAWTIPNTPTTQAKVKITDAAGTANDLSNAVFTIVGLPTVTVVTPNGGENWVVGAVQNITWTSANIANVKIEYTTNNGTSWITVVASVPATPATYAWTIPNTPTAQAKVKITDAAGTVNDESNAVFTISSANVLVPIITLRQNNAQGVPVDSGNIKTVRGTVTLANEINSPSYFQDTTAGIAMYSRGNISPQLKIGDVIQITARLTHFRGLTQFDSVVTWAKLDSNKPVAPKVLTIPQINNQVWNGVEAYEGSLVRVNGVRAINATGNFVGNTNYNLVVGTDTIQMRVTTGTTLVGQPIPLGTFDVIGALGQYKSTAPYQGGYQVLCRMASDVIPPPTTLTIVAPVGGESWNIGSTQQIKWTSLNVTKVKMEYTTNNGTTWTLIGYAPSSPYNWVVPVTPTTQAKVRLTDSLNATLTSTSAAVFTIKFAPLGAFNLSAPAHNSTVIIKENDLGLISLKWTRSANAAYYSFRVGYPTISNIILGAQSPDTTVSNTQAELYSWLKAIGAGNVMTVQWAVWAFNPVGTDSLRSTSVFNVTFNLIPATTINDQNKPTKFDLAQNYPNPFNPSTKIQYQLPTDGHVKIAIYNMVGELVMNLVDETKSAGYYEVDFDGKNLNSGIYIYKMTTGNFTSTKKMILVK